MSQSAPSFGKVDLTDCDREPIRIPGSIQPHGLLLALDPTSMTVVQIAGDPQRLIGKTREQLLGQSLTAALGAATLTRVVSMLRKARVLPRPFFIIDASIDGRPVEISAHLSEGLVILELEPRLNELGFDPNEAVRAMTARADSAQSLAELLNIVVEEVGTASGFDRVMLYRFLEDDSGHVVAEHRRSETVDSFLDLHYPASDIPVQARELYCNNWIRSIPDVGYRPQPLDPPDNPITGRPLDLSFSALRSVSPVHLEYLGNMGIAASMSLSLVIGGKLWGLIACHHNETLYLGARTRAALELFAQLVSPQIRGCMNLDQTAALSRAREIQARLEVALAASGLSGLLDAAPGLLDLIPVAGAALLVNGEISLRGLTPTALEIEGLRRWLDSAMGDWVYATDRLSDRYLPAAGFLSAGAGLLALSISRAPRDYVLWFLPEWIGEVTWGGEPTKLTVYGPLGDRLTPRKSFAAWTEMVRGRSRPWTAVEIESATSFRTAILVADLERRVAERTQALEEVNRKLNTTLEQRAKLIDELTASNIERGQVVQALGEREADLRLVSERQKQLIDGLDDYAIYWLDTTGLVEIWNSGAQKLKGYEENEIIGQNYSTFFLETERAAGEPARVLATALRDGKCATEGWRVRRDGSTFWSEVTVEAVHAYTGVLIGFATVSRDVSERRALEQGRKQANDELLEKTKALVASEEKYTLAVRGMSVGVWDWDVLSNSIYWSERLKEMMGVAEADFIPNYGEFGDRLHPDDKEAAEAAFRRHIERKAGYDVEYRLRHNQGHYIWIHATGQAIWNERGEPRRMSGSVADISKFKRQQQALRESEETFRSAMEYASIGMALAGPDGRWLKVNRALTELLGYTAEELMANDFQSITHADDLEQDLDHLHRALDGQMQSYTLEKRYYHRDGHLIWTTLSASLIRNAEGQPLYFIFQILDITERKELDRLKTEFISIVSHELRTPLTSIRGSLGLMLGTLSDEMSEEATEYTTLAYNNCERLIGLINDILDIDMIAAGQMRFDFADTPIKDLVEEAVEANQAYAAKYGLHIVAHSLPTDTRISVDSARFVQVLTNLLSNAAKFSPQGADVDVTTSTTDGGIRVNVIDRGPGIPDEFRDRIFGKFAQSKSGLDRSRGGTGLGLHVARTMVLKMNGNIGFDSSTGMGSTFWIEFPLINDASADPAAQDGLHLAQSTRILLFGADQKIASDIGRKLEAGGMFFDLCHDLAEARKLIAGERYKAIVVSLPASTAAIAKLLKGLSEANLPMTLVGAGADLAAGAHRIVRKLGLHFTPGNDTDLCGILHRDILLSHARPQILHIENDADFCAMLRGGLRRQADVTSAHSLKGAEAMLRERAFDLIVLDLRLPDAVNMDWARYITERASQLPPIVTLSADTPSLSLCQVTVANLLKSKVSEREIMNVVMKHAERLEFQHG